MRNSAVCIGAVLLIAMIRWNQARAQSATDRLQPLIETSARRLAIGQQVALSKWASGAAVEDQPREGEVIRGAATAAEAAGLDPVWASAFFRSQIEANKLVQYSLLADWRRSGHAPHHPLVDLKEVIRPRLDQLQSELVVELRETARDRAAADCQTNIAKAIGLYLSRHRPETSNLTKVALDRALSAACTK
jgi:chorismate mutase